MASFDPTFSADELQSEEWRAIPGYEGYYEASSLGRIRRIAPCKGTHVGRILKSQINKRWGRRTTTLYRNARGKGDYVHRFVAAAFLGPCPKGIDVNHKDGNKLNNRADNLEYMTRKENIRHAVRMGLWFNGEKHYKTTMTAEKVRALRRRYAAGELQKTLAKVYGITPSSVSQIVRRACWKHI